MTTVSVIIPAWNRVDQIVRSVRSVLDQTFSDLQVVVVDNGSSDGTPDIVEAIDDPRLLVLRLNTNRGASGGRNAGLAVADGVYVGFLDSDDEFAADWAESLLSAGNQGSSLVTCGFAMVNADGSTRFEHGSEQLGPAFSDLIGPFQAGTFLVERTVLLGLGGYAEGLRYSENTDLGLRLAAHCVAKGLSTASVNRPLLRWHHNPGHVYDVAERRSACAYMLEQHGALFARDPRMLCSYRSQLAVWDARAGDFASARRHFWSAWRTQPRRLRNLTRIVIATVPAVGRRVWP